MVEYDSKLIQKFADRLYRQANTILVSYPLVFGLVIMAILYYLEFCFRLKFNYMVGFIVGALIGYLFAAEKAFKLKLEAQTALCQVKIEENTRK